MPFCLHTACTGRSIPGKCGAHNFSPDNQTAMDVFYPQAEAKAPAEETDAPPVVPVSGFSSILSRDCQ